MNISKVYDMMMSGSKVIDIRKIKFVTLYLFVFLLYGWMREWWLLPGVWNCSHGFGAKYGNLSELL